jgi:hypothetical protein
MSDHMAAEAARLQTEAQQQAERAAQAAREMAKAKARPGDDSLEATVKALARQVKEMQASKEEQEAALRQQLKQAAAAQGAELHRYRDASLELKREVERLRHTVETYKAESEQTVKELQQQKDINRRLSRRLSSLSQADPLSDHEDAPGHDAAEQPGEHHRAAPAESAALQSPARSHKSPGKPARRPQEPPTPRPPVAATPYDLDDNDHEDWDGRVSMGVKVPSVTPSKARAPAIYNEPRNKARQQEYASVLEEQIAERQQQKKQQHREDSAATTDYFPFGRPGSGAPVRDEHSNVVTNVTFSRNRRIVPLDHPAGPLYAKRSASAAAEEMFVSKKKK